MVKLASWCTHHRKTVILAWFVALIGIGAIGNSVGSSYSSNFTIPNSDAQRAYDLLAKQFPQQAGDRDQIVFKTTGTTVLDPSVKSHMEGVFGQVRGVPDVSAVISPYQARGQISKDGHIAFASVIFTKRANELPESSIKSVISIARSAERPGLEVELGGQAIETAQKPSFGVSTAVGLLAAIVVLLITFGSLLAMGLPIVTALFGLGTGLSVVAIFTHVVETPSFAAELTAMIGLGVGIDYALFILTRFREAYATPGPSYGDVEQSVITAMDTAGRAVLFAGMTVVVALLGMMVLGIQFLFGVAIAASLGVLLMMLASLTLLPASAFARGPQAGEGGTPRRRSQARRRARRSRDPLDCLVALRGPPPAADRAARRGGDAHACGTRSLPAARLERRGKRSDRPDDLQGIPTARRRLWPGLQRPADDRHQGERPGRAEAGPRTALRGSRRDARAWPRLHRRRSAPQATSRCSTSCRRPHRRPRRQANSSNTCANT